MYSHFSKRYARVAIFAVTLGNLLEWYEIFLYVYWAPIISNLFFDGNSLSNLTYTFLLFAIGFLARPIGGIVFGRIGDRIGRRQSLIFSVMLMIIPTLVIGFIPTYEKIGIWAPYLLGIARFLQAFPAGGEIPGAFCYLYESSPWTTRRYMCSWTVWGYQIGILLSSTESFFIEKFLPHEILIEWGWRVSFIFGGLLGLVGLCLRYQLHETPLFKEMHTHEKVVREPILELLYKHRRGIIKGFLFCALNSSSFYLISVNFPVYFGKILGISYQDNLLITIFLLIIMTLPLPIFGKLADHYNNKTMLISSMLAILILLYPIYLAQSYDSIVWISILMILLCILISCSSALIPYIVADLFPTHDRFTCTAVSFNLADSILGGFSPFLALFLAQHTKGLTSFIIILFFGCILSMIGYLFLKPRREPI
ncbi:MAG TPA: MFS transporter [Chlamydiales bacterium]|nr:MFS transporter [Chlamydiales bacterium]